MEWRRYALIALLGAAPLWGCGDDNQTTGPDITDLADTWLASPTTDGTRVVLRSNSNPLLVVDAVNALGGTITLTITAAERFTLAVNIPNPPVDELVTGDFVITGNNRATLTSDDDPDNPLTATISLSGDMLGVRIPNTQLVDLNQDGQINGEDSAELDATFARN